MLYRRGKIFWFKFRFVGRVYRESTKTSSKTLARDVERVRRRDVEAGYNRVPKRLAPRVIEVEAQEWLLLKRSTLAPSSYGIAESCLRLHLLPRLGGRLLLDVDAQAIARYQRQRIAEGAAPKSVNLEIGTLRALLRHHALWTEALRRDVRSLKVRDDRGIALTVDEERRLTSACGESRSQSLLPAFVLALQTGLRYTELRLLRWSQIDFLSRELTVGRSKTAAGTGRVVPLNARALAELQRWATRVPSRAADHYLFAAERIGRVAGIRWTQPDRSAVGKRHGSGRSASPASGRVSMTSGTRPVRGCSKAACRSQWWQRLWVGRQGRPRSWASGTDTSAIPREDRRWTFWIR